MAHVWDYSKEAYQKQAAANPAWHLERLLTYGAGGEKLDKNLLLKHFNALHIPENTRVFFELLLWNKPF